MHVKRLICPHSKCPWSRARLHYSMWMEQHLSLTKVPFWTGGRSILVLSSTDQQISTPKILPACHKLRQTLISIDHRARRKSRRQSSNSLVAGMASAPQAQRPSLLKFSNMVMTALFCHMWDEEVISQQLKDAFIICLYKNGNRELCDNYRGISLLTIAGKLLARVLLNRLIVHLELGLLPESHCGFRGGRGTIDMIFAAHQLQGKCQE